VSDQMASYHCALHKTIRWYHKVATELHLRTAVVNAMHLYNERSRMAGQKNMNIVGFREKIVNSLLKISCPNLVSGSCAVKQYLRETEERGSEKALIGREVLGQFIDSLYIA